MSALHRWVEQDDICTLYVGRYGTSRLPVASVSDIAERRKIKPGSFLMRIKNFNFLEGRQPALSNAATLSKRVLATYGHLAEPALRELVIRILR